MRGTWDGSIAGDQLEWMNSSTQPSCPMESSVACFGRTKHACHCELADGSMCAHSSYTGSEVKSSDLTRKTWTFPQNVLQSVESEQNLKGGDFILSVALV